MALSKDQLLGKLTEWQIAHETIGHPLSPTCEIHSANIKGTAFEKYIGKGQAKNLFFKVPSGGGPLKSRLFLVCALVETVVDNKVLSARLGIKPSAPLRFAADEVFTDVLQIPKGSVNPFVMAQASCKDVVLLLDKQFLNCESLLFHPMQSDFTTSLAPDQLTAFLEQAAPSRYLYVDLTSKEQIKLPELGAPRPTAKSAAEGKAKAQPAPSVIHGFRDTKVLEALSSFGVTVVVDPIGRMNTAGRLEGHSTHNFFVHDKKDKQKRMLITVGQASTLDMKAIPDIVGCKEVRLCNDGATLLGSAKGCITPLSLLYDESNSVQWFVDDTLLADEMANWRLGTSEEGVEQGTVADVPVSKLREFLSPTGHWSSKRTVDCSRWAVDHCLKHTVESRSPPTGVSQPAQSGEAEKKGNDAPGRTIYVYSPFGNNETDFSTWYQPPYKTASGLTL